MLDLVLSVTLVLVKCQVIGIGNKNEVQNKNIPRISIREGTSSTIYCRIYCFLPLNGFKEVKFKLTYVDERIFCHNLHRTSS